jgi:penicillin-binding protein 1A
VALRNYRSIPPLLGIGLHPSQVAEQQRLIELKRTDPGLAQAQASQAAPKSNSIMPDQTRVALKKVAETMRQAAGLQPTPTNAGPQVAPAPGTVAPKPQAPEPKAKSPTTVPQRRAEVPGVGERPRP